MRNVEQGLRIAAVFSAALLSGCVSVPRLARHGDPLTPGQHVQLGAAYEAEGLKDDARRQYDAALSEQRKSLPALMARGNLAFNAGDLKTAGACYRRALRIDPGHPGANNNLAMVLLSRGKEKDLEEAERLARRALERAGPLRPYALDTLASISARRGRPGEALELLAQAEAALPSGPSQVRAQLQKARMRIRAGERG